MRNGSGWLIMDKIDFSTAVAKLRLLPDGAGWEAVIAAVPTFGRVN
jgi:hypothetical protein